MEKAAAAGAIRVFVFILALVSLEKGLVYHLQEQGEQVSTHPHPHTMSVQQQQNRDRGTQTGPHLTQLEQRLLTYLDTVNDKYYY